MAGQRSAFEGPTTCRALLVTLRLTLALKVQVFVEVSYEVGFM